MSRMTCRNAGVLVAAICLGSMMTSARAGNLDAPAAPSNALSAMWTLNDIYNVLDTRTTNVIRRTAVFGEPTGGPTIGTMHTLNDIMTLVTNRAPVSKTGQTQTVPLNPAPAGSDGNLPIGVAWPNPRFTVQANTNCVRDNLTGLIWARNANQFGAVNWAAAVANCNNLNYGGTNDWRLPNIRELTSLLDFRWYAPPLCNTAGTGQWAPNDPFTDVQYAYVTQYWTSTLNASNTDYPWVLEIFQGYLTSAHRDSIVQYVWPVRGGQ